ncbi:hypothetical protein V5F77_06460 [Xanthobacter sp. DSM 24535]|uniref:DUF2946 family protein n=1 Tax=Roseixanthobacter psychrophilus TaxID=3119917 RepID=UPI00372A37D3
MSLKGNQPAWRACTALAAAYLLVLQILVAGLLAGTLAARAAGPSEAGIILCTSSAAHSGDTQDDGSGKAHLPPCCSFGCPMVGWLGLAPAPTDIRAAAFIPVPPARPGSGAPRAPDQALSGFQARAPPA